MMMLLMLMMMMMIQIYGAAEGRTRVESAAGDGPASTNPPSNPKGRRDRRA
jgi:hypothetical protein